MNIKLSSIIIGGVLGIGIYRLIKSKWPTHESVAISAGFIAGAIAYDGVNYLIKPASKNGGLIFNS